MKLVINLPEAIYKDIRDNYEGSEVLKIAVKYGKRDRPKGEWIKANTEGQYKCSNCFGRHKDKSGEWDETFDHTTYNFCPNCGARMEAGDSDAKR